MWIKNKESISANCKHKANHTSRWVMEELGEMKAKTDHSKEK